MDGEMLGSYDSAVVDCSILAGVGLYFLPPTVFSSVNFFYFPLFPRTLARPESLDQGTQHSLRRVQNSTGGTPWQGF